MKSKKANVARIHFRDGSVATFKNQQLAYSVWLSLPRGTHAAFRGIGDSRPIYAWDYADKR